MSIHSLYTSPKIPGSFSGLITFKKNHPYFRLSKVKDLDGLEAYSLHKSVKRKFSRRKTIVAGIDDQWQVDLMDIKNVKFQNSHFEYLLTCIDVFRKFAWVVPIKKKTAEAVRAAFELIFQSNAPPNFIYSDWGNEFKGVCKKLFQSLQIVHIDTKSSLKASVIERFNRTLRDKIWRYMTFNKTKRFIEVLPDLVKSYNSSFHTSIGMSPNQVNSTNESKVHQKLYGLDLESIGLKKLNSISEFEKHFVNFKFKVGDRVRLVVDKKKFEKGSTENWSKEFFSIVQLFPTNPPTYKVKNLLGKVLDWKFYQEEIQKASE